MKDKLNYKITVKDLIKETYLLLESQGGSDITSNINTAIDLGVRAMIVYPDSKSNELKKRTCFIYSFGSNKKGNQLIRVFDVRGGGSSGDFKWKTYRVDKIHSIELNKRFKVPNLPVNVPSFRTDGDKNIPNLINIMNLDKIKNRKFVKNQQQTIDKSKEETDIDDNEE